MMNNIKPEFEEKVLYTLSGSVLELKKVMIRPYDKYIGKTILFGEYNEAVKAWYTDVPVEESTESSCIIRTSYGNNIEFNEPISSGFGNDDVFFAMHCHDKYVRLWFACDPRNIINDYIKLGFELASPYVKADENQEADKTFYGPCRNIDDCDVETFDIILPTHPNCWEKEYDNKLEKCKCKFTIAHSRVDINTEISYRYTSKVEDFIHCIVPMDEYILIEAYDLPKDREYVRISLTIANDF